MSVDRDASTEDAFGPADRPGWRAAVAGFGARLPSLRRVFADPVWRDAIAPTIAIHIVLLIVGPFLLTIFRPDALHGDLLQIWNRWDGPHFLELARLGYGPPAPPARIVLFPLYPGLIALGSIVIQPLLAAMTISFIATVAAAAGIYRLAREDHGRRTATMAALAINVFPTAYAFVAPYSEAPFLAFVAWCLYASRRGDWRAAGVLALLAGLTRLQGAFLVPALGLEYLLARRRLDRGGQERGPGGRGPGGRGPGGRGLEGRELDQRGLRGRTFLWGRFDPNLAWIALGLLGPITYLAINFVTYHDPLYFVGIQDTVFHVRNVLPWDTLEGLVTSVVHGAPSEYWTTVYLAPLAAFVILALATIWTLQSRRSHAADAAFTALNLVSLLTLNWPISVPRYLLGIAPMFVWLGSLMRRPMLGPPLLLASGVMFTAFMTLFLEGHWAF